MTNINIRLKRETIDYYKEKGKKYNKTTSDMMRQVLDDPVYDTMISKKIILETE